MHSLFESLLLYYSIQCTIYSNSMRFLFFASCTPMTIEILLFKIFFSACKNHLKKKHISFSGICNRIALLQTKTIEWPSYDENSKKWMCADVYPFQKKPIEQTCTFFCFRNHNRIFARENHQSIMLSQSHNVQKKIRNVQRSFPNTNESVKKR